MSRIKERSGRILAYSELFDEFDLAKNIPNLKYLSNISLQSGRDHAESHLTAQDISEITDSVTTIEQAAKQNGFDPLIVDFSLIMDERRQGLSGEYGYYHSFFSINTVDSEVVAESYLAAIYKEHRLNPSRERPYESIVTHIDLFSHNTASVYFDAKSIADFGLSLPEYKDDDHVGAYRFDVEYVEKHKQSVIDNIGMFLTNFGETMGGDDMCEKGNSHLLVIPFRRAYFKPVGELAKYSNDLIGSPGGSMFIFLRNSAEAPNIDIGKRLRRLVRRVTWILSHSAVGEAVSPSQQRMEQLDRATATYGMAHPLKHRWGEIQDAVFRIQHELTLSKPDLSKIKNRAENLSSHTRSFGDWVELAYLLYYAASMPVEQATARLDLFRQKVFLENSDYDLLESIEDEGSLAELLGPAAAKRMRVELNIQGRPILRAKAASSIGRRMPTAVYRQFIFEMFTNARKYGVTDSNGIADIEVGKIEVRGFEYLVFSNLIKTVPPRLSKAVNNWIAWDSSEKPGGLSFVDQILRWTQTGEFRIKIDSESMTFMAALKLNGLEFENCK